MGDIGLVPGIATAIGSLPHRDARVAAALVLRSLPDLPAAPQLPHRTPLEGMIAPWASAVPGVIVHADGTIALGERDEVDAAAPLDPVFTPGTHGSLLTFLEVAAAQSPPLRRVKVQMTGPLTLGVAFVDAGMRAEIAFPLAARVARAWALAIDELAARMLPGVRLVLFFDEPSLVCWRGAEGPVEREVAIDLLSSSLAATRAITGVHVCGRGDVRLALDAGPHVVHFDVGAIDLDDAVAISRFLDGGGWFAWGAIPTHRPVGEHALPLWKGLLETWCDLTRRGCDPARLRTQALIAPACGLAGHGESQAEHAMLLAREIGGRVHGHAAACKLAVGA
jgi:hypothetical protein